MEALLNLGFVATMLIVGYTFGRANEKKHYKSLLKREAHLLTALPYRTDSPKNLQATDAFLLASSTVIASDYFKNFVATIRNFFGGRLSSHESLLDRARREALCRVREKALARGASEIVNVRIETVFLDQLGIEVSAYGTAIKR